MPTGYTADLEKKKYNVKQWLKENVIRAMGVCVMLRDNDSMSEAEILKALRKEEGETYNQKALKTAKIDLAGFIDANQATLTKQFEKAVSEAEKSFEARSKEHKEKSEKHIASTVESKRLYELAKAKSASEVTINTLKFAVEQLESAFKFDYGSGPYREGILSMSFEQWKEERIKKLTRDVEYHSKEVAGELTRQSNRYAQYKEFVDFVNANP